MFPDSSVTLHTHCICQGTGTGMSCKAASPMTDPRLTEVTDSTLQEGITVYKNKTVCVISVGIQPNGLELTGRGLMYIPPFPFQ